jgi:hypothetical protein
VLQTNGIGSKTAASSIVAVHQKDLAGRMSRHAYTCGVPKRDASSAPQPLPWSKVERRSG